LTILSKISAYLGKGTLKIIKNCKINAITKMLVQNIIVLVLFCIKTGTRSVKINIAYSIKKIIISSNIVI